MTDVSPTAIESLHADQPGWVEVTPPHTHTHTHTHTHNMDYPPTQWPRSPRIVLQCAFCAPNGPNHLGFRVQYYGATNGTPSELYEGPQH